MIALGQTALLVAFVASGYAAFSAVAGSRRENRAVLRTADLAAVVAVVGLLVVTAVLAVALVTKDFRLAYVVQYSSRSLPWHYSLSALWVGQAGSLLLWASFTGLVTLAFRATARACRVRHEAFGVALAYLWCLVAVLVFAADPLTPSSGLAREGAGLSPLLQHPAMLVHPPVVFLGYAAWAVPFALTLAALAFGRCDAAWLKLVRGWSLFAWSVLGAGILLGAVWAYQELGWGGYWAWDAVENSSLLPWLTGTALLHSLLAWQHRGVLKRTSVVLTFATFALCNFATFLTRSGLFSSLHAFSRSAVGWTFLGLLFGVLLPAPVLLWRRRSELRGERPQLSVWSSEWLLAVCVWTLLLLAGATLVGTLAVPLSVVLLGRKVSVGPAYYNSVLVPTGLVLLAGLTATPLARWGRNGGGWSWRRAAACVLAPAAAGLLAAWAVGVRHPVGLAVAGLAAATLAATGWRVWQDVARPQPGGLRTALAQA